MSAVTKREVLQAPLLLVVLCIALAGAQNRQNRFRANSRQNPRRPARQNGRSQFGRNGVTRNGSRDRRGTEVYPGCSGKVCLPEAQLCADRKEKVRLTRNTTRPPPTGRRLG